MTQELVEAVNENLMTTGERLASTISDGEIRQFGPVRALSTGLPAPQFNRIAVTDPQGADNLPAAVTWLSNRGDPFWVTVPESVVEEIGDRVVDLDLVKVDESPGMALASLDGTPGRDSSADIKQVTEPDGREEYISVFAAAFETPPDMAEQMMPPAVLSEESVRLLAATMDRQAVACGLLSVSGNVAGVYNIGVHPDFRRQGLGEAMTWAVLEAGREAGCTVGVLESSEMAYPLYDQMGFETVVDYRHFAPPAQAEATDT